jgi:disulfide bond formation protein DsbB
VITYRLLFRAFIDSFCIEIRYVMVTYYVILFVSLLLNYLPNHIFYLSGMYIFTYITFTMSSLIFSNQPHSPLSKLDTLSIP